MQTFTVSFPLLRARRGPPAWPLRYEPPSTVVKRPHQAPTRPGRVGRGLGLCRPAVTATSRTALRPTQSPPCSGSSIRRHSPPRVRHHTALVAHPPVL